MGGAEPHEDLADRMILADLQSEDPARIERAYQRLTEHLLSYARTLLRTRFNQVHLQDGSVVQSAIAGLVERGPVEFLNEAHLQGRMRLAVLRKIQDRIKAGKNRMAQQSPRSAPTDSAAPETGAGIPPGVVDSGQAADIEAILLDGLDPKDRDLVDLCLLQKLSSAEVARQLGMSADLVRQRVTRLRPQLRRRLLAPVQQQLSPEEWRVVKVLLLDRMPPRQAAAALGVDPISLSEELLRVLDEVVRPLLGPEGCSLLVRLLGRPNS